MSELGDRKSEQASVRAIRLIERAHYIEVELRRGHERGLRSSSTASLLPFYREAGDLRDEILARSDQQKAKREWLKIAFAVGKFYLNNCSNDDYYRERGFRLVKEALFLSVELGQGEEKAIIRWMESRQITMDLL